MQISVLKETENEVFPDQNDLDTKISWWHVYSFQRRIYSSNKVCQEMSQWMLHYLHINDSDFIVNFIGVLCYIMLSSYRPVSVFEQLKNNLIF